MKILVTGGNGTMGKALREFLPDALYLSRAECDVTNGRQLYEVFYREQPDVVIHAAAITDHQHPNTSEIIETNIMGTGLVARYCREFRKKMVYLSTHYVYPGETGNYKETDPTRPIGTYAWSKLAGEGWAQIVPEWLIVRGSWYDEKKLDAWERQGVILDAVSSRWRPDWAACFLAELVKRGASGIYNIGHKRPRSFAEILAFERPWARTRLLRRKDLYLGYDFPRDSSVNTDKYEALVANR